MLAHFNLNIVLWITTGSYKESPIVQIEYTDQIIFLNKIYSNNNRKQSGAELCQAQDLLELSKLDLLIKKL